MNESDFWRKIREGMKGRWLAQRIESATSQGIPDVSFCLPNRHGWAELKMIKEFPKRSTTKMNIPHFTEHQKAWLTSRGEIGGNCWLFVGVSDEFFVFSWRQVNDVCGWTADEWRDNASLWWKGKACWPDLYQVLLHG